MIAVQAVQDPATAKDLLRDVFGFKATAPDRMPLGDQEIVVCDAKAALSGRVPLLLDHLAFIVTSADTACADVAARGAELDPVFTPGCPAEIRAFWSNGVRFAFLKRPDGAPFEFCRKLGDEIGPGHSHYGLGTADLDQTEGNGMDRARPGSLGTSCPGRGRSRSGSRGAVTGF